MSDNSELPPEAEQILKDAERRAKADKKHEQPPKLTTSSEQKAADDWLAAFAKKSQEELAARAAEERAAPAPNEKALVEVLALPKIALNMTGCAATWRRRWASASARSMTRLQRLVRKSAPSLRHPLR
jgi:hypothetical protein